MEILSFEGGSTPARKKRSLGLVIGAAIVAGISVFGSTLASSVTIGSGPVTFGQGSVQAVACDSSITVTPEASFANTTGNGSFALGAITISDLDNATTNTTTGAGCGGKKLVIKVWGDTNTTALTLSSTVGDNITASVNNTIGSTTANTGVTVSSSGAGILKFAIGGSSPLAATSIYKITVEQQN